MQKPSPLSKAADEVLKFTCQFLKYKEAKKNIPIANGCGLLLEYNSNYYCISNAHVIGDAELEKTFILLRNNKTVYLGGQYYQTRLPDSGRRSDDKLDVAVLKLNPIVVSAIIDRGYNFMSVSKIKTGYSFRKEDKLLIAGFPASKTKLDFKNQLLTPMPIIVRTIPYHKDLSIENFSNDFHFVVSYPIKSLVNSETKQYQRAPDPHGLSGSGLWLLSQNPNGDQSAHLIGIVSEYHENRAVIISTKIDLFIDLLRQRFDPSIPNFGVQLDLRD